MTKKILIVIGALVIIGLLVFTGKKTDEPTSPTPDTTTGTEQAPFEPGIYLLDQTSSTTAWEATRVIGSGHIGSIEDVTANLEVNTEGVITEGLATFDLTSLTNTDLENEERRAQLLGHLASADFFDTTNYPTATYVIESVEANDAIPGFSINGNLDLKGTEAGLVIGSMIEQVDENTIRIQNTIPFDRTIWGVNFGSGSVFDIAKDQIIDDTVTLTIDWTFVRETAAE